MIPASIPVRGPEVSSYRVRPEVQPYPATLPQASTTSQPARRAALYDEEHVPHVAASGKDVTSYRLRPPDQPVAGRSKSAALGIAGLTIVLLAAVVYFVACYRVLVGLQPSFGPGQPSVTLSDLAPFARPLLAVGVAMAVGAVGWALSIAAVATKAGRAAGVAGIVVGALSPLTLAVAAQAVLGVFTK